MDGGKSRFMVSAVSMNYYNSAVTKAKSTIIVIPHRQNHKNEDCKVVFSPYPHISKTHQKRQSLVQLLKSSIMTSPRLPRITQSQKPYSVQLLHMHETDIQSIIFIMSKYIHKISAPL